MSSMKQSDIQLDGRVVIITGADRGIGREFSIALAGKGATVILASPEEKGLNVLAREIETLGGRAIPHFVDITSLESCRALIKFTVEETGHVDVLINNARRLVRGPGLPPEGNRQPLYEANPEIYKETVNVNVTGTFFMSRAAVEHFLDQGKGKIINITTSVWHAYQKNNSPYGVTKAAIEASTQIWSRDLEGTGVTVNSLLPGASVASDPKKSAKSGLSLLPIDIMNPLVIWLSSERSDGVTGCRFVGDKWDPNLSPDMAALASREEPVFQGQPLGTFIVKTN